MGRSGDKTNPFVIPRAGRIVAFTIALGKPSSSEKAFFDDLYGGPPQVRISVLRAGRTRKTRLTHRLLSQSGRVRVDRYFGSSPTFVFGRPLRVSRGNRIALTVPPGLRRWRSAWGGDWWRSSRRKGSCSNVSQRAQQQSVGGLRNYGCTYFTARLTYSVTYVPDPRRTN